MNRAAPRYHGYRFPLLIISHAVWRYHRFCRSFRDAEDLLAQRGITVSTKPFGHGVARSGPRTRGHFGVGTAARVTRGP